MASSSVIKILPSYNTNYVGAQNTGQNGFAFNTEGTGDAKLDVRPPFQFLTSPTQMASGAPLTKGIFESIPLDEMGED
ncbi:hypothetical protein ACLOJK_037880 [Asimina triloba]